MAAKSGNLSKEDELLLLQQQDYGRPSLTAKAAALFYGNALIVSAIPVWLYWRVHNLDPLGSAGGPSSSTSAPALAMTAAMVLTVALSTYLVALAYKNTKGKLKHQVAVKREAAVAREVNSKLADDKKISRKEKDERIVWKKNEVAEYESTNFAIFYNNALFLTILIVCSFYILSGTGPLFNYIGSMGLASGLVALFSTKSEA